MTINYKINDYNDYTQVEKLTVAYIRKNYKFTVEANQWLRAEIRTKATTRVRDKQTKDPTSSKFQKKTVFTNLKDAYNWDKINSSIPYIVVGARSAIFAPLFINNEFIQI